jgi:hypothetical protein
MKMSRRTFIGSQKLLKLGQRIGTLWAWDSEGIRVWTSTTVYYKFSTAGVAQKEIAYG